MSRKRRTILLLMAMSLVADAVVTAQEPAASFDALRGRIEVGQTIRVTDRTGAEVRGRFEKLTAEGLVLSTRGVHTFVEADVRRIRARETDSLKNGALIGLGAGVGMASVWCGAAIADSGEIDARVECAEGFIAYPALGALIGMAIDRVTPGRLRVVYEAPPADSTGRRSLMIVPVVSTHARGLALSFGF